MIVIRQIIFPTRKSGLRERPRFEAVTRQAATRPLDAPRPDRKDDPAHYVQETQLARGEQSTRYEGRLLMIAVFSAAYA